LRRDLPHADWVELQGVGHCPQLDVPLQTAQLILGFTHLADGDVDCAPRRSCRG
jgi:pimeloyl-ACP methyl ester carboxylesterase